MSALAFLEASLQTVADGDASLRQEVVQLFGGEGPSQRFQGCKSCLGAAADDRRMQPSNSEQTEQARICVLTGNPPLIHQVINTLLEFVLHVFLLRPLVHLPGSCFH